MSSSLHHDQITAAVTVLLDSANAQSCNELQDAIVGVAAACASAFADYAQQWNAKNCPFLRVLPFEVRVRCLGFLDRVGLVRASQVSRAMRRDALDAPTLWSDIVVDASTSTDWIAVTLARSKAALIDLHCTRLLTDSEIKLLAPHSARVRALTYPRVAPRSIFPSRMAALEEIEVAPTPQADYASDSDGLPLLMYLAKIPVRWAADSAPRLWRVRLPAFKFPPPNPSHLLCATNITHFEGEMQGKRSNASRLFEFCPLLQELRLSKLSNGSVMPLGPIPTTLRALKLSSLNPRCDVGKFLGMYSEQRLHRVVVFGCHDFNWAFSAFSWAVAQEEPAPDCNVDVQNMTVTLKTCDEKYLYDFTLAYRPVGPQTDVEHLFRARDSLCGRIVSLSLSHEAFIRFLTSSKPKDLARLRCLRIVVSGDRCFDSSPFGPLAQAHRRGPYSINFPALHDLVIEYQRWSQTASSDIHRVLVEWLEHRSRTVAPPLGKLCYNGFVGPTEDAVATLRRFCERVVMNGNESV